MKKVLLCLGITLLIFQHSTNGQYIDYSLMLAQTTPGGTARSTAMGGAWGALGGDFYSAVQNPAGLGFYRNSELTFTPELLINQTQATYYGSEHSDFTFNPNMNSFGYVYANTNESGSLKGFSFAFGYNKLNNFNQNIFIKGSNGYSSFSDAARLYLMEQDYYDPNFTQDLLNGDIHPGQPFFTNLFWDSFVVDYDSDSNEYWVNQGDLYDRYPVDQEFTIQRSGKANEWSFAMGFNINHKLYLGGSFAFISLKYNEKFIVGEYDYDFTEEVKINGVGYTGKLGAIYKPVNALRIGLAWHLPVFYNIDDRFSSQLNFDNGDIYSPEFDYADYTYSNITPSKYVGSVALIPNKFMLVSADFEYINYSNMQLLNGQDNYNFSQENDDISTIFYPALNTKIGAEFRFGTFRARGGFAYLGSPYKEVSMKNIEDVYTPSDNTAIENTYKLQYSLGIGFRGENFFLDIAQVFQTHEVPYNIYDDPNGAYQYSPDMAIASNVTELSSLLSRTMVTVGFRF